MCQKISPKSTSNWDAVCDRQNIDFFTLFSSFIYFPYWKIKDLQYSNDSIIIQDLQMQEIGVAVLDKFDQTHLLPAQLRWKVFIHAKMVLSKRNYESPVDAFHCNFQTLKNPCSKWQRRKNWLYIVDKSSILFLTEFKYQCGKQWRLINILSLWCHWERKEFSIF